MGAICGKCYVNSAQYSLNGKALCAECFNAGSKKNSEFRIQSSEADKTIKQHINVRKSQKGVSCQECGFFEEDFIKTGFVGCERCYAGFKSMDEQINLYQGNNLIHRGK